MSERDVSWDGGRKLTKRKEDLAENFVLQKMVIIGAVLIMI